MGWVSHCWHTADLAPLQQHIQAVAGLSASRPGLCCTLCTAERLHMLCISRQALSSSQLPTVVLVGCLPRHIYSCAEPLCIDPCAPCQPTLLPSDTATSTPHCTQPLRGFASCSPHAGLITHAHSSWGPRHTCDMPHPVRWPCVSHMCPTHPHMGTTQGGTSTAPGATLHTPSCQPRPYLRRQQPAHARHSFTCVCQQHTDAMCC
jgi:hypothetical protein